MDWKYFSRQLLLCTGPWSLYFMQGLSAGLPTVLVPQLRRENHTISDEMASWLMATPGYSGIPWVIALSALVNILGRKKSHIIVCTSTLIGFIIFYYSLNMTHFIIGGVFHGGLYSAFLTTCIVIMTECTSSKYRGVFLTFKSTLFFWGVLTANAIGTFFHWQYIVMIGIICGVYSLINVLLWPESPLWLASKGRLKECAAAHRWLKGKDEESERELKKIILSHENNKLVNQKWSLRKSLKIITQKKFMIRLLLSNLLACLQIFSGKIVCTVYAIDILKKITSSESTAYIGMLILDCVSLASMYVGCYFCKLFRRRVILIGFSSVGISFMAVISVYLYLAKLSVFDENKYISITLLAGYSISISIGPMIFTTTIIAELLPLEYRTLSMFIIALNFKLIATTSIKLAPFIFRNLALHGTFALYAVLSGISLIVIYIYLPETKDKTLQEIDSYFRREDKTKTEENLDLINGKMNKTDND